MGWFTKLITGGIGSAISGILAPIFGYMTTARNDDLSGFQSGVGSDTDRYKSYLSATVQMAQIRASQNMWLGARILFLIGAAGPVLHSTGVYLDSLPWFGHVVGSWGIPRVPAPYDDREGQIVLSFFILAPAAPVLSAAAAWLHRR
jgi:hypothetical protein